MDHGHAQGTTDFDYCHQLQTTWDRFVMSTMECLMANYKTDGSMCKAKKE